MKRAFAVNGVVKHKSASWHPLSRRDTQDRRVSALRASNPEAVRVQHLLDGSGKFSVFFECWEGLADQPLQLLLHRQSDGPLDSIQFPLQRVEHLPRIGGFVGGRFVSGGRMVVVRRMAIGGCVSIGGGIQGGRPSGEVVARGIGRGRKAAKRFGDFSDAALDTRLYKMYKLSTGNRCNRFSLCFPSCRTSRVGG